MCVGIPAQVVESGEWQARCRSRQGEIVLDMRLVGSQPVGTWVLAFLDTAREILDAERAAQIDAALDALDMLSNGTPLSATALDALFPDLAEREPQLPDFLKP
ncbi:MAG: HypC/HybG/HupF family hydrogenase formation chaperone [Zoogloeaceae bacterium]|jgi:hydrogenase expression/formation protein HypC|nr:HypC/HybG/HupF family hydrogenase formation chaperone [Zoogloeaceae bacterium]